MSEILVWNHLESEVSDVFVAHSHDSKATRTVLLIGSTGNGKSCLGNFLLNSGDEEEIFRVARDNAPTTKLTGIANAHFDNIDGFSEFHLNVIDTPGLNEGTREDLQNIIGIIEKLRGLNEIGACILVVKFDAKIDAQYKETVKYYAKLLPSLFEKNVIIVMTKYATHEAAVKQRKKEKIDVEGIKYNTVREIMKCVELKYEPMLFTIDCVPLDEAELKSNLMVRYSIFQYLLSCCPLSVPVLRVAKTPFMFHKDQEQIRQYEGEANGYNDRLKKANKRAERALSELKKLDDEVNHKTKKLYTLQSKYDEKNTSELVTAQSWSTESEWKFLQSQTATYDLMPSVDIENVKRWSSGEVIWEDEVSSKSRLKGVVKGNFMRGLYANITIETQKRKKYKDELEKLGRQLEQMKENIEIAERKRDECRVRNKEFQYEIGELASYVERNTELIRKLSLPTMSIEEAYARLAELTAVKFE